MKNILLLVIVASITQKLDAQSTHIPHKSDYNFQLERFDILNGIVDDSLHTTLNPVTRKDAVRFLEHYKIAKNQSLNEIEKYEIEKIISKSGEWASNGDGAIESDYSLFNTIYLKQPDFINYNKKNIFFVLNPVIQYQQTFETGNQKQNLFLNSKGIEVRGLIADKIGFYSQFTDNQERGPLHHQNYVRNHQAIPGFTYFKDFKIEKLGYAHDYLNATGYIDASIVKNTVNVTFGTDKFHVGDGYRSLFLSDFGSNYTFLKLNTRFWKINYQNLFLELTPQYHRGADRLLNRKYATMHHLSINPTHWLNIGLFESVIFGRKDHFDFRYLNPIILYRSVEQTNGSPDNALLGANFKINTGLKAIIYGQVIIDEFVFSKLKEKNGSWANKFGLQFGLKFADLFNIKNLLVQLETNIIRPYTYSFRDSIADYSNYNQPLAHPLGANLLETDLIIHYMPFKKTTISLKSFYNKQGLDTSSNTSFGANIFKSYNYRNADTGIYLFNGMQNNLFYNNLNFAYEIKDNFYFDIGITHRLEKTVNNTISQKSFQIYTGLRLNANRKQYDY